MKLALLLSGISLEINKHWQYGTSYSVDYNNSYENYQKYIKSLEKIIAKGNSSSRQRNVFNDKKSLQEVVKMNVEEFKSRSPIY